MAPHRTATEAPRPSPGSLAVVPTERAILLVKLAMHRSSACRMKFFRRSGAAGRHTYAEAWVAQRLGFAPRNVDLDKHSETDLDAHFARLNRRRLGSRRECQTAVFPLPGRMQIASDNPCEGRLFDERAVYSAATKSTGLANRSCDFGQNGLSNPEGSIARS